MHCHPYYALGTYKRQNCKVELSYHFDVNCLQCYRLWSKSFRQDVLDEPFQILFCVLRLFVDDLFAIGIHLLCLLYHELLQLLDFLLEVALSGVVADDAHLVFNVFVVYVY